MVKELMKEKKGLTIGKRIIETHGGSIDIHAVKALAQKLPSHYRLKEELNHNQ
jgi:hypothetical protein